MRIQIEKIDEIRNYLIEEINQNELTGNKHKKVCRVLNYIAHSAIIISSITEYVIGIEKSAIGLKICVITAAIEKYKSINKKRKRNMIK